MGARTSTPQGFDPRSQPVGNSPDPGPRSASPPAEGPTLNVGPILVRTIGHFFPDLNDWIDQIDDPRFAPLVIYHKRFLMWWGLCLFLCKLRSRRQLDYQLNTDGPEVLNNLNRLAGTAQVSHVTPRSVDPDREWYFNRDHAWFAGYSPAASPEIAIVVLIEHGGGGGKNAVPVAMRVVRDWEKLKEDRLAARASGTAPGSGKGNL